MFIKQLSLSRRTFLRGAGAAVALPLLDSMLPAFAPAARAAELSPKRFGGIYVPHGFCMEVAPHSWVPEAAGANFQMTPILLPAERHRDRTTIVSGLNGDPHDGGHSQCPVTWLSGALPKRTEGRDIYAGATVDQIIAAEVGQDTMLPSLEVATEDFTGYVGSCDPDFSCVYLNTISWASGSSPLPMETNPRVLFERLFGGTGTLEQRIARIQRGRSILDSIKPEADRLGRDMGGRDRARLEEYLNNIREIERRLERAEKQASSDVTMVAPKGIPADFREHVALMYDLTAVALESDITRVFTYMVDRELSHRTYPELGVLDGNHNLSHHNGNPEKIEGMIKIQAWMVSLFANFMDKLQAVPDGDGTLLDHVTILYGSGMADGSRHSHKPMPVGLFGGPVRPGGRHIALPQDKAVPHANLLLTLAHQFGAGVSSMANSNGTVAL